MAQTVNMIGIERTRIVNELLSANALSLSPFLTRVYKTDLVNICFNTQIGFAEKAVYEHKSGETQVYDIIYDDPQFSENIGLDARYNTVKPQFQIADSVLLFPIQKNERVTVRGIKYYVDLFKPDGVGVTTVYLRLK